MSPELLDTNRLMAWKAFKIRRRSKPRRWTTGYFHYPKGLAVILTFLRLTAMGNTAFATSVSVLTYHNDNARTGQNTNETVLTLSNVNTNSFGLVFNCSVDGYVYGQPLVLASVTIPGQGVHNVVYVATEHDSVYAFDADSNTGSNASPLWQVSFLNPSAGVTSVPSTDVSCNSLVPEVGITSTPVIDPASGTLYVEALTKEIVSGVTNYVHRLHALDVTTGAEKFGGPVVIQASVPGSGVGNDGAGNVPFKPLTQINRAALLLDSGTVYIGFASLCDNGPFHGWLFGFNSQTLVTNSVLLVTPNGEDGGIWLSGGGPACDSSGNIFVATGNGTFDPTSGDYGDSLLKLPNTAPLAVADYFTPFNQSTLETNDLDLNSGGAIVLPDEAGSGAHPHLVVGAGKQGTIYLVDRDNMGQFNTGDDSQIVESIPGAIGGSFDTPAYFNHALYYVGANDIIRSFAVNNGSIDAIPLSEGLNELGWPGATPSISANGTNNAIAWALQTEAFSSNGSAVLHAYNAADLAEEIYNSNQAGARDVPGAAVKFTVPTVANGKVYVGTESSLAVFGNSTIPATPTIAPNGGAFSNSVMVSLADATGGTTIYYTLDGTTPTTSSLVYSGAFTVTNNVEVSAAAFQSGSVASAIATASFTIISPQPPVANFNASPRTGPAPLTVVFSDTSSGTITGRSWSFGDGGQTNVSSTTVQYVYLSAGTNTVVLTVSGPGGASSNVAPNYISVTSTASSPPQAAFTASPTNGVAPLLVNFTDLSTGAITNQAWDFGDGNTSSASNPSHTYSTSGVYTVSLTVTGPGGANSSTLPALITATNLIGTAPTVNILRPGNEMLYPRATNLTVTIVAQATSHDSSAINHLEFFVDGVDIGQSTSNPGTNLLLNPTFGPHLITVQAIDAFGATGISSTASITIGAPNSPLGVWEVAISGADRGTELLTFQDDFTAQAFAIRMKSYALEEVSGNWTFDAKGKVTGVFLGQTGGATNWTGTLLETAKSLKSISGIVPDTDLGTFHWKGSAAKTPSDLSGTWTGLVTLVKTPTTVNYVVTADTNHPGIFNVATALDPATVAGQVLLTSRNKVFGYLNFNGKQTGLSGTYKAAHPTLTLKGTDQTAEKVSVKIFR